MQLCLPPSALGTALDTGLGTALDAGLGSGLDACLGTGLGHWSVRTQKLLTCSSAFA